MWKGGRLPAKLPASLSPATRTLVSDRAAQGDAARRIRAVLMRKDPPFDTEYVASTWLLELAQKDGAKVFNDPRAIRDHSEKLAIAKYPQFSPPTLVTRLAGQLQQFIDANGDVVLKPLGRNGRVSVFRVASGDPNRNVIVETLVHDGAKSVMAQRYIPEIREGDKRILLIAGKAVPHCLARIPKPARRAATSPPAAPASRNRSRGATWKSRTRSGRSSRTRACFSWAGRDRGLAHRDQRHQPYLLPGNHRADPARRRRMFCDALEAGLAAHRALHRFPHASLDCAELSLWTGLMVVSSHRAHGAWRGTHHGTSHVLGQDGRCRCQQLGVTVHDDPDAILPSRSWSQMTAATAWLVCSVISRKQVGLVTLISVSQSRSRPGPREAGPGARAAARARSRFPGRAARAVSRRRCRGGEVAARLAGLRGCAQGNAARLSPRSAGCVCRPSRISGM